MLTLFVSSSVDSGVGGERRFDEDLSIRSLKVYIELSRVLCTRDRV